MTDFDLDLDVLANETKKVKYNGELVEFVPPEVGELFAMMKLSSGVKAIDMNDAAQVEEGYNKLRDGITKVIPALKEARLNIKQLFALLDLIIKSCVPKDISDLEKHGITLTDDQKKTLSDLSEKSEDSSTITPVTPST